MAGRRVGSACPITDHAPHVTGTGIGLILAQAFAKNGAKVYITSRRRDDLEKAAKYWGSPLHILTEGKLKVPVICDVTSKDSIRQLVDDIRKNETRVDVLVNNAGGLGTREAGRQDESIQALAEDLFNDDPAQWEDVYRTSVIGAFRVSAAFLPFLHAATTSRPSHTGSIINISSIAGITRTNFDRVKYSVSKAASVYLTMMLAQKFRSKTIRVRVNSIVPGVFPTEMAGEEENLERRGIPADRPGRDEDITRTALMLACNEYAYALFF
ncbi:hypothetical protein SCLCIDRAFT_15512 [Scleroderma citrinum Foug A]|uniref:Ketoreductase (KR) domain-containing protein n=1 Tax=Scleroderma citrinum Foug A TaxID=1036808 RepID=A0A0C3E5I4_9AGAM|nr:hypothetical protein SCLCIDRAFT_15512 [Scleroderma citrinum Foug A]